MEAWIYELGDWLEGIGAWAYLLAPLIMAGVSILPIPAEAPAMINGALFGPLVGFLVTWLGAMLGATASFELARSFGRPAAGRVLPAGALARVDGWMEGAGWRALLAARLTPVIAFTVLNWGAGLTAISRWRFLWTTAIGIVPGTLLFVASGWGMTELAGPLPGLTAGIALVLLAWVLWRQFRLGRARSVTSDATDDRAPSRD